MHSYAALESIASQHRAVARRRGRAAPPGPHGPAPHAAAQATSAGSTYRREPLPATA